MIAENKEVLSEDEWRLCEMLLAAGQGHIFEHWETPGTNDANKHALMDQVAHLDKTCPGDGGLTGYVERAKELLKASQEGANAFEGYKPSVPIGVTLNPGSSDYSRFEELGMTEIKRCGFALVAGGLGERLGYNDIKLKLPVDLCSGMCYLELYCKQILALQKRYGAEQLLPLAIMVSGDTEPGTVCLLEENDYFGLCKEQVTIMKQEKVPALLDNAARLGVDHDDPYLLMTKPHGHGDVHSLMHSTGTAARWLKQGQRWVIFMQDTNGLALQTLGATLGVSVEKGLEVNSMCIPRKAGQAIGGIMHLEHQDGRSMTVNVEYNLLDSLLRESGKGEDANDPETGFSPFPGNINQLVFALEPYVSNLERTGGVLGEFVNPKYADSARTVFKKPARLECMMQDYPKALEAGAKVGFTSAPAWLCFSPVKNSLEGALKVQQDGAPAASAATGEADQYFVWGELLRLQGCDVGQAEVKEWAGIKACMGPMIVMDPSVAVLPCELARCFPTPGKVVITPRSTLVVKGEGVVIESLKLDGALVVEGGEGGGALVVRDLSVENEGWEMTALGAEELAAVSEEYLKIRGYCLTKHGEKALSAS
ncbi:unnamed protein product [Chrysoparadoxa australica]